jgi:23S rRNA maturation mini-RNase III
MANANPMRWVVLSLVVGAVFAIGLVTYVRHSVEAARARAQAEATAQVARRQQATGRTRLDDVIVVTAPFVSLVGRGRFAEAHALLAAPYRQAVTVEAFSAACRASPILSGARTVSMREVRQQSAGGAASLEARGLLLSTAGAVPIGFVLVDEAEGPRILTVSLAGVPVLQGVPTAR